MPNRCCDEYDDLQRRKSFLYQNRRGFLKTAVGALAMAPLIPEMVVKSAFAQSLHTNSSDGPILVVIQLAGGNDGLNTVVPYSSDLYYKDRPTINVPSDKVLQIDKNVGFSPYLTSLKTLFDQGKVAVVQDVGYPNPDLSHFRSTQIWESGDPVSVSPTGWLGRYLDTTLSSDDNPMKALAIGPMVPLTLQSQKTPVPSIETISTFRFMLNAAQIDPILQAYRDMYGGTLDDVAPYIGLVRQVEANADFSVQDLQKVSTAYKATVTYPQYPLARDLQLVSQIIASGLGTRIFHVTLGGFDDHAAEVYTHQRLMQELGDSVAAFFRDLESQGKADNVVMMTFSEFGRRVRENAGQGTDHGTAAPMFVIGSKVKGGLYGNDPALDSLDSNGDLHYQVDFRSVYGTILDGWLGGDSKAVLGGSFERLPFL